MMKTLIASTGEIDDAAEAVRELKAQLKTDENLCANSIGIISCHQEFITSGAAAEIIAELPFDIAGIVTLSQAVNGIHGDFLLSLMVLTGDDVSFVSGISESLTTEPGKKIADTYRTLSAGSGEKPALIFSFAPFMLENSGDEYVNVITEVSGGVPCFGTMAIDGSNTFENSVMLYNTGFYRDRMAMILVYGDIKPRFFYATISPEKIIPKAALITKSDRHILMEVNGKPLDDYFKELGLTGASEVQYAMASLPFMLDYNDGTPPVSKVLISRTPENYAICAGIMPESSSMYVGVFDKEDVLLTTGKSVAEALGGIDGAACMLMYSCISRSMSLGVDSNAELELLCGSIGDRVPFMAAYSGGEMCPTQVNDSRAINRFHNNTFIMCVI